MDLLSENEASIPTYWGYIGLAIAVFFFGSNYLPVKQYQTGDGMFFQLVLCLGIWSVSFVVASFRDFPKFYPLAAVGGVLWATGNVNTVPIIKCIGLGLGMLFWGITSLVIGWANARFGWFGVNPQVPSDRIMNYIGVSLAASSAIFYLFIKSNIDEENPSINETEPLIEREPILTETEESDFFDRLNPSVKKILGTSLAIFAGVMYGLNFTPVLYIIDNYSGASKNGLDYVFSMYTGILMTSLVYFTIYCAFKRNNPFVNTKAILPGLISG